MAESIAMTGGIRWLQGSFETGGGARTFTVDIRRERSFVDFDVHF